MARTAKQVAAQRKAAQASAKARTAKAKSTGNAAQQKEAARMAAFRAKDAKLLAADHIGWATRGAKSKVGKNIKPGKSSPISDRASDTNRPKVIAQMNARGLTGGVGTVYAGRRWGTSGPEQLRRRAKSGDAAAVSEWAQYEKVRARVKGTRVKK